MGKNRDAHPYQERDGLFRVSADDSGSLINVVYVHGLGGGAYDTWFSGDASELGYWPDTLASDLPTCSVWTLNYTARVFEWNPFVRSKTIDILDKSAWFLDQLDMHKINSRPIVFVAHSLGGILVKQALQFAQSFGPETWRSIWEQTRGIVFLATPHSGSSYSDFAVLLARGLRQAYGPVKLFLRPSPALERLGKNKPSLRYLRAWYRDHAPAQGIDTFAYAEGRPLGATLVVDKESANPQAHNTSTPILSDQDHVSIAKPKSRGDTVYQRIYDYIGGLEADLKLGKIPKGGVEPVLSSAGLQRLRDRYVLISRLAGYWWEGIELDGVNHLSFFRIETDPLTNSVAVGGESYTPAGEKAAEWDSEIARIVDGGRKILIKYFWKGRHVSKELANQPFHGFGEMVFGYLHESESVVRGSGGFWEVNESKPEATRYRSIDLRRAEDEKIIRTMTDGSTAERAAEVIKKLCDW